jgi:hypothetical protein
VVPADEPVTDPAVDADVGPGAPVPPPPPGRWTRLWDDLAVVLPAWAVARVLFVLGWWVAHAVADRWYDTTPTALRDGLLAWDGAWYRDIAQRGYEAMPVEALRFFPGYPWLARALSPLTGFDVPIALLVLTNAAAIAMAVLVRRLVRADHDDPAAADRAVWVMTLFPSAFVLVMAYGESLFLVGAVGAFLAARRGRWGWVVAAGLLAGLTRPLGLALAVALAVEAARSWGEASDGQRGWRVAGAASPVVGTALYLAWVDRAWGRWTLPFTVQDDLRAMDVDPLRRLLRGIGDAFGPERFGDALHIPFAVGFVVLAVLTVRRWPASYTAYAGLVLLAALSAGNLNSIERYALNAFPLLLTLALVLRPPRWERLGLAVCGGGFVALTALAFLGLYVP